eukprot:gene20013-21974_t
MEFYAVLGLDQTPRKFRSVGVSSEFYCYFPPPLPDIVVIFSLNGDENTTKDDMHVQLHLDGETDSVCKTVGQLSLTNHAICFDGGWDDAEQLLAREIQDKGRLIKLVISPRNTTPALNEVSFSQDSGISEHLTPSLHGVKDKSDWSDQENSQEKEEKKQKKQKLWSSPLSEVNKTYTKYHHKTTSVKRKTAFDFDDDKETTKHVKFDQKNLSTVNMSPKVLLSPMRNKPKKIDSFFTPKSSKSFTKNQSLTASPVTPGLFELKVPSSRWGHTMCHTTASKAIMIGGQGMKHLMCKDSLWQYDFSNGSWRRLEDSSKGTTRRMGHTSVYNEKQHQLYIFGGCKNKKWYHDIHTLNTDTLEWKHLEVTGKAPPRSYHSCNLVNEELLIFGGVFPNPDPVPDGCSNDVYFFNTVSNSWYQPIVSGERPRPRSGHSANLVQGKLFIFGGWDAPTCFNDLWTLDLVLMNFQSVETTGQAPLHRSWHGSLLTRDEQRIVIHGGYNGIQALNDVYTLRLASMTWSKISNDKLAARAGHLLMNTKTSHSFQKDEDNIVIFGGGDNNGTFFNDISELVI